MAKHILFLGTGGDFELKGTIHFDSIQNSSDYTMCGVTMDYDPKTGGDWEYTEKPVNCQRCADIVKLCKSFLPNEITKGKLR